MTTKDLVCTYLHILPEFFEFYRLVMLLLLENRQPQLHVSLDKDTNPFAV